MLIGVPKEIKNNEFRVGLTPSSVNDYIHAGHHVLVEQGAGLGSGFSDQEYIVAVSYTHLDVYKRQPLRLCDGAF